MNFHKIILSGGAAVAALCSGGSALAQTDTAAQIGEVVVTAQKRSERLIDVPMSISATSGEALTAANISSTGDLQQVTPGLVTVNNGFAFTPAIRGVSSSGTSPGDENNVSLYLDDVYMGAPLAGLFSFKDIERVEVLKGPQGTLFGRNATGGAVRIVTKAPSFTPGGELSADYGFEFKKATVGAYLTGPLIDDKVAGSLNLFFTDDQGYIDGVGANAGKHYASNRTYAGRAKLLFELEENFRATVSADYSNRNDNVVFTPIPRNMRNSNEKTPGYVGAKPHQYSASTQPFIEVESYGVGLDATWEPSDYLTVRSISAFRAASGDYVSDADRTSLKISSLFLKQKQKTISQELNFSGPAQGSLTWIAGLYYYHSKAFNPYFRTYAGDPSPTTPLLADFTNNVETNSYAAFGELTWNATDQLHFIVGGRYNRESKNFYFQDIFRPAGLRTANVKKTWPSTTYRAVARYDFARDWNIYASASNGFKSGVFNAYALPAIPVEPEKIKAYEIGMKGRINRITLTAAAFQYNYSNIQVQGQTFLPDGAWVVTLSNAARAKIQGFELTASGPLTQHLSFDVGVSALPKAEYSKYVGAQVFIFNPVTGGATNTVPYDASGSRIVRSPKWQGNASLTWRGEVANGELMATANYSYNDGFNWQPGNLSPEASYQIVNAKVSWTDPSGRLTYSVWAENLTNETYSLYTTSNAVGINDAYAQPRQIGVGVSARF